MPRVLPSAWTDQVAPAGRRMFIFPALLRTLVHLALLLATGLAQAANGPILIGNEPSQDFTSHAEILPGASDSLVVQAVAKLSASFNPIGPAELQRRYDTRPYWLRAALRNANANTDKIERWLVVGHPRLESATLFQKGPDGWIGVESGLRQQLTK